MSYYVWGSSLSWSDYLQAKSFVSDITSSVHSVQMDISRQTREVIASNEALAREHIMANEELQRELSAGFERLSYDLQNISSGIYELNATFHWGFGELIAGVGHMNDALSELIKIAKTPVQTVAFNHFEIARDAFRQKLFQEALEELQKSINGDHTSPGYKLEWRFHQLVGTIRLGFADGDLSLIDLPQAEQAFLLAARYAKTDYPKDAGHAFLSAGWTAYCQGKMKEALTHTENALACHPQFAEALFQSAKVRMALGEVDNALSLLGKAITIDRFYALKAAGDGDFQKHDARLQGFLEAMRKEKYKQGVQKVEAALEKIKFWMEHSPEAKNNQYLKSLKSFLAEGEKWPLTDMLFVVQNVDAEIAKIEDKIKDEVIIVSTIVPGESYTEEEDYQEKETYQEEVVIKPGSLFRKAVREMQTKTRMVTKTRLVTKTSKIEKNTLYDWKGNLLLDDTGLTITGLIAKDNRSGLIWSRNLVNKGMTLDEFPKLMAELIAQLNHENYLGYNDWRRPTREELEGLAERGKIIQGIFKEKTITSALNRIGFSKIDSDYHWSFGLLVKTGSLPRVGG